MVSNTRTCLSCAYFASVTDRGAWGECRKNPPKEERSTRWPECRNDEWCGQWVSAKVV